MRAERPTQLYLEVGGRSLSVMSIFVTLVFVLIVGMLASSVRKNDARADDWRQRAVAAEEIVGGLRVVIAERSKALNERTVQANRLATGLDTSRGALQETKSSVGSLTRRQRQLAADKALAEKQVKQLESKQASLVSAGTALNACGQGLEALVAAKPKPKPAAVQARLTQCSEAQAHFKSARGQVVERTGGPVG